MENGIEIAKQYFPVLSDRQQLQFMQLGRLYREWNSKINVISRQDIDNLYLRHVLHSLAIAKVISFRSGTRIVDAGTGGGFPGIPLAIMFPGVKFHLIDSTAKKLTVIKAIAEDTGLQNISTEHTRIEDHEDMYDFAVSRAVASLDKMVSWVWKNIKKDGFNELPNGILYLKGGEAEEELKGMGKWGHQGRKSGDNEPNHYKIYPLNQFYTEPFFETKYLVHLF